MSTYSFTVETLNPSHYADLAALRTNPRHPMTASRRNLFRRLGLIEPAEPPPESLDSKKRRPPPRRGHVLTRHGESLLAANVDRIGEVGRVGWGS